MISSFHAALDVNNSQAHGSSDPAPHPLLLACTNSDSQVTRYLIQHGGRIDEHNAMLFAEVGRSTFALNAFSVSSVGGGSYRRKAWQRRWPEDITAAHQILSGSAPRYAHVLLLCSCHIDPYVTPKKWAIELLLTPLQLTRRSKL